MKTIPSDPSKARIRRIGRSLNNKDKRRTAMKVMPVNDDTYQS